MIVYPVRNRAHWLRNGIRVTGMLLLTGVLSGAVMAKERTWTSSDGNFRIQAELIRVEGEMVILRRADNRLEIKVPLAKLSDADQAIARSTGKPAPASATEDPFAPGSFVGSAEERRNAPPAPRLVSDAGGRSGGGAMPSVSNGAMSSSGGLSTTDGAPSEDASTGSKDLFVVPGKFQIAASPVGEPWTAAAEAGADAYRCGDFQSERPVMAMVATFEQDLSKVPPAQRLLISGPMMQGLSAPLAAMGIEDLKIGSPKAKNGRVVHQVEGNVKGQPLQMEFHLLFEKRVVVFAAIGPDREALAPLVKLADTITVL